MSDAAAFFAAKKKKKKGFKFNANKIDASTVTTTVHVYVLGVCLRLCCVVLVVVCCCVNVGRGTLSFDFFRVSPIKEL